MASALRSLSLSVFKSRLVLVGFLLSMLLSASVLAQAPATDAGQASTQLGEIFPLPDEIKDYAQLMKFVEGIDSIEPEGTGEE